MVEKLKKDNAHLKKQYAMQQGQFNIIRTVVNNDTDTPEEKIAKLQKLLNSPSVTTDNKRLASSSISSRKDSNSVLFNLNSSPRLAENVQNVSQSNQRENVTDSKSDDILPPYASY
jgi:hypothetical protein